jgi:hypothetical protein
MSVAYSLLVPPCLVVVVCLRAVERPHVAPDGRVIENQQSNRDHICTHDFASEGMIMHTRGRGGGVSISVECLFLMPPCLTLSSMFEYEGLKSCQDKGAQVESKA